MYNLFKYLKEKDGKDIPNIVEWEHNIELYYKDKALIDNEEHLMILDKAYECLYDLLTDDLDNLETFEPKSKGYYDVIYGYSKDNILLAYDEKNGTNDIHLDNFYSKFESYMSDYINDYETHKSIIHGYLVNTLQMRGTHSMAEQGYVIIAL